MTSNIPLVEVAGSLADSEPARLFSDSELANLATPAGDKIQSALKTGNLEMALHLCAESKGGHHPLAFGYFTWNGKMLVHVYRTYGLKALGECIESSLSPWFRPLAEQFRNGVTREAVSILAQYWRMASQEFGPVEETEDKFSFEVKMFSDFWRLNQFDELSASLPVGLLDFEQPEDRERESFSLLSQSVLYAEALMITWLGYPAFTVDFNTGGEPCKVTVYKDPMDIPAERFARVRGTRDERRIRGAVDLKGGRFFSDLEITRLNFDAFDLAQQAIADGDLPMAMGYAQQSKNEWYPAHHALRDWITGMLSYVYRLHGVDATHEAVKEAYENNNARLTLDTAAQQNIKEQVTGLAAGFLQHAMRFRIVEDNEKFIFMTEPCGSGGRLLDEGAYAGPKNFALIKERHESTFYLENFPVYCMHCPSTNIQIFERGGPYYLMVDGDLMTVPDGNCNFYIFKNPDAIPERFYSRAGRVKPGCGACS
jgi:hypothetical protein